MKGQTLQEMIIMICYYQLIFRNSSFLISKNTYHIMYIQMIIYSNWNKSAKSGKLFGKLLLVELLCLCESQIQFAPHLLSACLTVLHLLSLPPSLSLSFSLSPFISIPLLLSSPPLPNYLLHSLPLLSLSWLYFAVAYAFLKENLVL